MGAESARTKHRNPIKAYPTAANPMAKSRVDLLAADMARLEVTPPNSSTTPNNPSPLEIDCIRPA